MVFVIQVGSGAATRPGRSGFSLPYEVIIDVDPISSRPGGADDLVRDQPQIDQALRGLGTFGAQVPDSSSSSPRLPRREIDWNDTPWKDDIFEDNEDMQALRTSIVTINHALTVSLHMMYFS
jgi:hypothetical protein